MNEPTGPTTPIRWAAWSAAHPRLARLIRYGLTVVVTTVAAYFGLPAVQPALQPLLRGQEEPIDYEGAAFHGDHHEPVAVPARWPTDRITYSVDYNSARNLSPPLSGDAIRTAARLATAWWAESLALEFVEVDAGGLIPIRFEAIDGPQGVLAEAFLANGTLSPKPMRVDSAERWTAGPPAPNLLSLPTVICHELGHSLGLGHDNTTAMAVMRPSYTSSIPREQPRDISRMVQLGYARRIGPPPPPGSGGTADLLTFPVSAKAGDLAEALKKAGYGVTPPPK